VSGALAFANYWMKTSRTVTVAGTDRLDASFNAQDFGVRLEAGYHVENWLPFRFTPYAAAQVQAFRSPAYAETAASGSAQFALSFGSHATTTTRAEVGEWVDKTLDLADQQAFTLFARAAYAHDWASDPSLSPTFLGLPTATFVVNGAPAPHNLALATLGTETRWSNGWSLMARFDGEFASGGQTYAGTARVRYAW
jgi:outer membrane autotransporter protein